MTGQPHADRDRASPTPLPLGVDDDSWELFLADVTQLTLDRAAPRPDEGAGRGDLPLRSRSADTWALRGTNAKSPPDTPAGSPWLVERAGRLSATRVAPGPYLKMRRPSIAGEIGPGCALM